MMLAMMIRMEVASSWQDYLPTLSEAKTSKLSLLVKHHIFAIDEASKQQQHVGNDVNERQLLLFDSTLILSICNGLCILMKI